MTTEVSYFGLAVSIILPWILGVIWCLWLCRGSGRYHMAMVLGQGYLLGMLATTLTLNLWATIGLPLHYWSIAFFLVLLTLAGIFALKFKPQPPPGASGFRLPPQLPLWQKVVGLFLIGLLFFRYTSILQEVALRPLFPWDAWMNWAPKALIWFYHGEFTEIVSPGDWLKAPAEAEVYTLGAKGAWRFPHVIPLVQLWGMLGAGTTDHNLIYLPWILVTVALGLSLFGYLRASGTPGIAALFACYLLLSLPYLNVHVLLTGYADIWMTATFGSAVLALQEWERTRERSQLIIAVLLAGFITQMKVPGMIFGGIIVLSLAVSIFCAVKKWRLVYLLLPIAALLLVLARGVELNIENYGRLSLSLNGFIIPYIGSFTFTFHPVQNAVFTTIFAMANWHLLWFLSITSLCLSIFNKHRSDYSYALMTSLALSISFILFVYFFTERYKFAMDYTQINRALIYVAPLLVLLLVRSQIRGTPPSNPGSHSTETPAETKL